MSTLALSIPKEKAIGWLDCWVVSAGARDVDLALAWIRCLPRARRSATSSRLRQNYGNTTDAEANSAIGMTYGDQLAWLLTPENFEQARGQVWNEVKAS